MAGRECSGNVQGRALRHAQTQIKTAVQMRDHARHAETKNPQANRNVPVHLRIPTPATCAAGSRLQSAVFPAGRQGRLPVGNGHAAAGLSAGRMPGAAAVAGLAAATGFAAGFALAGCFFAGFLAAFWAAFFAGFLAAFFFAAFFAGFFAAFFAAFLAGFLAAFFAAFFAGFFAAMMNSFRVVMEMTKRKTRLYQPGLFIGASIAASLALMNAVLLRCLHTLTPCAGERSRASKKKRRCETARRFSGDNAHTGSGMLHGVGGTTPLEHALRSG